MFNVLKITSEFYAQLNIQITIKFHITSNMSRTPVTFMVMRIILILFLWYYAYLKGILLNS